MSDVTCREENSSWKTEEHKFLYHHGLVRYYLCSEEVTISWTSPEHLAGSCFCGSLTARRCPEASSWC